MSKQSNKSKTPCKVGWRYGGTTQGVKCNGCCVEVLHRSIWM